ncbi:MAG: hypothetical protein V9E87_01915 [Gemmatimonadales bacterium]
MADDLLTLKMAVVRGTGICALPDYMCRDELLDRPAGGGAARLGAAARASSMRCSPSRRGLVPAVRRLSGLSGRSHRGRRAGEQGGGLISPQKTVFPHLN